MKIDIRVDIVEDLFQRSNNSHRIYPCSTLILELKQSMESYMTDRLIKGGFVSLLTAFNHCLREMLTEDKQVVTESEWSGCGF